MQLEYTDQELVAMPRVNVELLDRVLDYIIDHPDEWDQAHWSDVTDCGTTFCFAGHTCFLAGEAIVASPLGVPMLASGSFWLRAEELLGLTLTESQALFIRTVQAPWAETVEQKREYQLQSVKVEVERIRARAKMQDEAFNRIAQEFIDAAGLEDVAKPGYQCPESEEAVQRLTGGAKQ